MPPKFGPTINGRGGGGGGGRGHYRRRNGRFDPTQAGDVPQVLKRQEPIVTNERPVVVVGDTSELEKLKQTVEKLVSEIETIKERLRVLELAKQQESKPFPTKRRIDRKRTQSTQEQQTTDTAQIQNDIKSVPPGRDRNFNRRRRNDRPPGGPNELSSEERLEGENDKERKKTFRRKPRFNRHRAPIGLERRLIDSSERNSNDTSPIHVVNGQQVDKEEIVQNTKRDFLLGDRSLPSICSELETNVCTSDFLVSILEHVICDVTSPAVLEKIAHRIYLMLFKDGLSQHQEKFVNALNNISNREKDLAIDAPRYMDSLGQFLAENIVLMSDADYKIFLNACISKYNQETQTNLIVSTFAAIAEIKDEKFARDLWKKSCLNLSPEDLPEFLGENCEETGYEPENKNSAQRLERFADDITEMVERKKDPKELLERLSKEQEELGTLDEVSVHGNLIYGVVRGCLDLIDSANEGVRVDQVLLQKYDSVLSTQREKQDEIALFALTLLTKLWYHHKCPKGMFINILSNLHVVHKTTTNTSLRRWLEDKDLHSIPGIGAARLHCKRFIDEVTGSQ